jgi:hypothetical protein
MRRETACVGIDAPRRIITSMVRPEDADGPPRKGTGRIIHGVNLDDQRPTIALALIMFSRTIETELRSINRPSS